MLHQENKISLFLCFFVSLFLCSCKNKESKLIEQRKQFFEKSLNLCDKQDYFKIYNQARDSIIIFSENKLGTYQILQDGSWQLDSLLCFNSNVDKLISTIIVQGKKNKLNNSLKYFYGVKINNNWYFYLGPTVYLFSEYYNTEKDMPLSFEKMKQIATMNIYRGYLKKNKQGEWEINEEFFSDLTSVAWCTDCITQEDWNKKYLEIIQDNWNKKDTIQTE